jgi:hypothetical protein
LTVAATDPLDDLGVNLTEREQLRRALGAADDGDLRKGVELLRAIAVEELVAWVLGRRRYVTIAESDSARILRIFRDIRKESPTRATLANDFALSPGRATSIAARLRYGEGRSFEALRYEAANRVITSMLPNQIKNSDGRQSLYITPDVSDAIMEVAATIMLDTARHAQDKLWEGAEMPEEQRKRDLAIVTASSKMWKHISTELDRRAKATSD